jgi:hypothetical protein
MLLQYLPPPSLRTSHPCRREVGKGGQRNGGSLEWLGATGGRFCSTLGLGNQERKTEQTRAEADGLREKREAVREECHQGAPERELEGTLTSYPTSLGLHLQPSRTPLLG